jgi:hypothetical protein
MEALQRWPCAACQLAENSCGVGQNAGQLPSLRAGWFSQRLAIRLTGTRHYQ